MVDITLVLAGGAARGFSFIGAFRALHESGVKVSEVVGTSMGAILGAAMCSGKTPSEIEAICRKVTLRSLLKPSFRGPGLLSTSGLADFINNLVPVERFEDLNLPLLVCCTDIESGRPLTFNEGPLKPILLGSSVLVGLFDPVYWAGKVLGDGSYSCAVPIGLAKRGNLEVLVDPLVEPNWPVGGELGFRLSNLFSVVPAARLMLKSFDISNYSFAQCQLAGHKGIHVRPQLGAMRSYDFGSAEFAIAAGEQAMREAVAHISRV